MFVTVFETGSFTAAAERLGTSSGQASKLVSRLEADLGVRLFNRSTRAVSATEAGHAYYDRLRPLLDEFDELGLSIRDATRTPRGRLRLTAPLTFGTMELSPVLNAFAVRYPEIELDVSFSDRVVNLVDEGFDMAVRIGRPGESSLIIRKLCAVRIVMVAAPVYVARHGTPDTPDGLAAHSCILDTNFRDSGRWPFRDAAGNDRTVAVTGRVRYSNAEACLAAAADGLGIACVPAFVAGAAIRSGKVLRLLEEFETAPYDVYVLYPHSRHLAAKVRVLVDHLAEQFRGTPGWEAGW